MKKTQKLLRSFLMELVLYAILVAGYFLLVVHLLGDSLKLIYDSNRFLYAVIALSLMVGQGFLLQFFTTTLLAFLREKTE